MKYYKVIENGVITAFGCQPSEVNVQNPITPEEYDILMETYTNKPENTFESVYYLDAETEIYLSRERTEEEKVDWFVEVVSTGTVKLEDVPTEYRAEVEALMPVSEEEQWMNEVMEEVSEYGY